MFIRSMFSAAGVCVGLASPVAQAQFVGDFFARVPSQAAPAGGRATVEVQLFSGANIFGASIFQITFTPGQLAVREVLLSGVSGQRRLAVDRRADGRIEVATFSVDASRNPIGTVTLAQVVFDVLAPPGVTARYRITPREVITQSETRLPSLRGADGDVVVVSRGTVSLSRGQEGAALPMLVADPESLARAAALRPRGGTVELIVPVRLGNEIVAQAVTVSPAAAVAEE